MVITGRKNANGNGSGNRSQETDSMAASASGSLSQDACPRLATVRLWKSGHLNQGERALRKRVPMMATTIKPTVKRNARS